MASSQCPLWVINKSLPIRGSEGPDHSQCYAADMSVTHRSERVEKIVESPGNDDNVVDVQPEGQNHGCQSHTCKWRQKAASIQVSSTQESSWASQQGLF